MLNKEIRITTFVILFFSLGWMNSDAHACEPCAQYLSFEETVSAADLIIIGQKAGEGPLSDAVPGGPEWIAVKVIKVLKGEPSAAVIKVNSWDAMCGYGIVVADNPYVMLLQKRNVAHEDYEYDAVRYGCGVKTYRVDGDRIYFEDQKIGFDEFVDKLK